MRVLPSDSSQGAAHCTCWCYDVRELLDSERFEEAMLRLPWEERKARVRRYRFEKSRALSLGAGLLGAHALRAAGATDLTLAYGEHEKPYLLNHPNIHFNLSHSGTLAVCAVAGVPVGVDVEELRPCDEGVARHCFQDSEMSWLREQDDVGRAFTQLWTRKESYLKLLGTGFSTSAKSFSVLQNDARELGIAFYETELTGHLVCVCLRDAASVEFVSVERGTGSVFNLQVHERVFHSDIEQGDDYVCL